MCAHHLFTIRIDATTLCVTCADAQSWHSRASDSSSRSLRRIVTGSMSGRRSSRVAAMEVGSVSSPTRDGAATGRHVEGEFEQTQRQLRELESQVKSLTQQLQEKSQSENELQKTLAERVSVGQPGTCFSSAVTVFGEGMCVVTHSLTLVCIPTPPCRISSSPNCSEKREN